MNKVQLHQGDCLEILKTLPDCTVDAVISDPPYGLSDHKPAEVMACLQAWIAGEPYQPKGRGFMGKTWDAWVPGPEVWRECLRVLKPGGHLLAFAGTRSMDLMCMAVRLAGFELRDSIGYAHDGGGAPLMSWCFGSGFPKSMDVSKAIDKAAGAEREVLGTVDPRSAFDGRERNSAALNANWRGAEGRDDVRDLSKREITTPATDAARQWQGWGTALKPAWEPIILARKPLIGTVAANVLEHGTGALNIAGCRVATNGEQPKGSGARESWRAMEGRTDLQEHGGNVTPESGRWPANLIHDGSDEVVAGFPESASGSGGRRETSTTKGFSTVANGPSNIGAFTPYADAGKGSAARFFYCAKASKRDRDEGLDGFDQVKVKTKAGGGRPNEGRTSSSDGGIRANVHPTVKPTDLMAYLCRLVTPPGGTVLDPFMGSGSTGKAAMREGFRFIGCELSEEYLAIARARIEHELSKAVASPVPQPQPDLFGVTA